MEFKLSFDNPITWPPRCVCCQEVATTAHTTYNSNLIWILAQIFSHDIQYRKMGLSYPVCGKHKYWAVTVRLIYLISFIDVFWGGVMFLARFFGMQTPTNQNGYFIGYLFIIFIFIQSIRLHPVRLKEVGEHVYSFMIRNEDYAKRFAAFNGLSLK